MRLQHSAVISAPDFLLCIVVSLLIGAFITGVYTYKSRYTTSFAVTLAMLPAIVCIVIMMVNGNVGVGVAVAGCTGTKSSTGNIVSLEIDAEEIEVQSITGTFSSAAVYVKSAEKVFVTLAEGSQNMLRNTDEYVAIDNNNIDVVIFVKSDLTLNGTGSLTIVPAEGHGIVSKDDLKITGGTYDITAAGHALSGAGCKTLPDR